MRVTINKSFRKNNQKKNTKILKGGKSNNNSTRSYRTQALNVSRLSPLLGPRVSKRVSTEKGKMMPPNNKKQSKQYYLLNHHQKNQYHHDDQHQHHHHEHHHYQHHHH